MKQTPLNSDHKSLGAKMVEFGGWEMPVQYRGILDEHMHTRSKASVFDTCHMGEFFISGEGSADFLDRTVSNLPSSIPVGRCRYGLILNEKGGVIDDTIVYCLKENEYLMVVNASTCQGDLEHLKNHLVEGVEINDASNDWGKIDLQGPKSFDIYKDLFGESLKLKYFSFCREGENLVSRTGYTGELGVEIYCPVNETSKIWQQLLSHDDVEAAGLGSRDTLRLECGLSLYGHELDHEHTPQSSGVGQFVKWDKDFIGKDAISNDEQKLRQVALKSSSKSSPRQGEKILVNGEEAGLITSGSLSPCLGHAIALGRVDRDIQENDTIEVDKGRRKLPVELTDLPFYKDGTARTKLS